MPGQPSHLAIAPRWITILDVLCLILVGMMVRSALGGGYQIRITPEIQLSMDSWVRLLVWVSALLVIRHVAWRVVPWHARVGGWARRALTHETFGATWPAFLLSRTLVLLVGYMAVQAIGFNPRPPWPDDGNPFIDLHARWDAGWYLRIAREGYPSTFNPEEASPIAFFPGLPLLTNAIAVLLELDRLSAAVVLVTCAFFWALTYVYRLGREMLTADQALTSILLLVFYPFAVAYSAVLTESVFLLAAAGAFYHFRRSQLVKAGIFGVLAGLVRPNGFLLCVPLGLLALLPLLTRGDTRLRNDEGGIRWAAVAAHLGIAGLPVIGMLIYAAHIQSLTGDGFAWMKAQQAWGRGTMVGVDVAAERLGLIQTQGLPAYFRHYPVELLEAVAAFFGLAAVWPITRRFGLAYGVFVGMAILPPLITMGSVSLGRYTAPLFPLFFWLAAAIPQNHRPYWLAAFATGQALVAVLFYTWRPPY